MYMHTLKGKGVIFPERRITGSFRKCKGKIKDKLNGYRTLGERVTGRGRKSYIVQSVKVAKIE